MNHLIAPSLLSANFINLASDIAMINDSKADLFHLDVMDGVFVPNISFGLPVISQIKKVASKPLDVHLMIIEPDRYIEDFKKAGADMLSVHYEACTHLNRTISSIKELGMTAGVVLNPHTNVNLLENIITDVDYVLLMSVNPGFGGQSFIENTYNKLKNLKELILSSNSKAKIQIDGGVSIYNAKKLIENGVDILVAGNAIFSTENPMLTIEKLKNLSF